MPNVYFAGLFAVLILAAAAGIYAKGGNDREARITAIYQARDLKAATDYAAKEREITEAYRKKESQLAQSFATVGKKLQVERSNHETTKLAALASAGSLRDPGTVSPTCSSGASKVAAPASGSDGSSGGKLSEQLTTFLISEASRADSIVAQLSACQQVLITERR